MTPRHLAKLLAPLAALLGACGHTPVPNEHSLLATMNARAQPMTTAGTAAVVIASCVVPASIDRPQLVLTAPNGDTRVVETERWAEPLKVAIPRALARSLMERLPGVTVWTSSAAGPTRPEAKLDLEIVDWRAELGGPVSIDLLWYLRRGETTRSGRARSQANTADHTYAALVAAQRAALTSTSEEIARVLQELLQKPQR